MFLEIHMIGISQKYLKEFDEKFSPVFFLSQSLHKIT